MTPRIQQFWQHQVTAEYASAAVTAEFAHWLIQSGASPDLIKQCLDIAQDEVDHALVCQQVVVAAGGAGHVSVQGTPLVLPRMPGDLREDLIAALLSFYCLGETMAVPLFGAMRKKATQNAALAAFDRIVADEPRHSAFGWLTLAWAHDAWPETQAWIHACLPGALQRMATAYFCDEEYTPALDDTDRAWGMLPRLEYTRIFEKVVHGTYALRLAEYGVDVPALWQQIRPARQAAA
jgi:hypothetical protein